jgi:phosphoglycolate phosphatase-like HAD superfamily hydrolase
MPNIYALQEMKRTAGYLICIDSDGCVFDTMEVKHKECFIPNIINYWNLQSVSKYARETAEYVNLYSVYRGINRFPAIIKVIDLLSVRPEVKKRGFVAPDIDTLRAWAETEKKLGNPALEKYVAAHPGDATMAMTLRWSAAVNDSIAGLVRGVPPFPYVRECLDKMKDKADVIVVSQTPCEALEREWEEHNINGYVTVIAGQEMGTKAQCIGYAREHGYDTDRVLMIGDAPGDHKAAAQNSSLFYPINPGDEDNSWLRLLSEGLDKFFDGSYAGAYEKKLLDEFDAFLPSSPPWEK